MIFDDTFIALSRLQFAATGMYHFIFVPLTLGLAWVVFMMEAVYVMTDKVIYRDMAKFWGKLFGINFALGVATGLTMEFQFGMNWQYYSHYVGDVFGAPLAIEGLMAFFLESTFVGLFFLGWNRLSKRQHLTATFLMALGSNLSALWILVANGWMQFPVGAEFNPETMRMEMASFTELVLNPVAQVKFVHTVAAGYCTATFFVLGISAWYMIRGRDLAFAKRSFAVATAFGIASVLSVIVLGDESGYTLGEVQKVKLAAIEAEYHTEKAPSSFSVIALPDDKAMERKYSVDVPWLMGVIATRSFDEEVKGIKDLKIEHEHRIRQGQIAVASLDKLRAKTATDEDRAAWEQTKGDLGYGLLLKRYVENVADASDADIAAAVEDSIPSVWPVYFSFRIMVYAGFLMAVLVATSLALVIRRTIQNHPRFLWVIVFSIPLPWLASEAGWVVAEYGRQPWAIGEVLPVFLATSQLTATDLMISLAGFVLFYTILLVIGMYLMVHFARKGPSSLGTGRYHDEGRPGHKAAN
ncbi:cytochrome ubiquinol oxidase subunit I [Phaeovibrio sulfidiphilus]|uniref:Cytochrome ubiquinol oxidase subunit I n=1 Tax=Phaeovibrio sulfidiphilus TaxID=1220600 RepID=A0A8J6YU27_9PROT|nr:cytochrome ubiquinol oxidase subunit I [Phaeovibrio sulfidiphilus]MBE1236434.1 cytochrome ubiquinol oxidase subunit I [Phaeovibrio sulfidiphilus]